MSPRRRTWSLATDTFTSLATEHWGADASCLPERARDTFDAAAMRLDSKGRPRLAYHPDVAAARTICQGCPVRDPCLVWALGTNEQHGILGGLTPHERANLKRRRRR